MSHFEGDNSVRTDLEQVYGTDHDFVCEDADSADLTSATLKFMLKRRETDTDAVAVLVLDDAAHIDPGAGSVTVTVTAEDLDPLEDDLGQVTLYWELKRLDQDQNTRLGYGRYRLKRGIIREFAT